MLWGRRRYRGYWKRLYRKNHDELRRALRSDPSRYLESSRPDTVVRLEFEAALGILAGGGSGELAKAYLQRVQSMLRRVSQQALLESTADSELYPTNRGTLTRLGVYADFLLGQPLNARELARAGHDYETWCASRLTHGWDAFTQYMYLIAVRTALVAQDVKGALRTLDQAPAFDAQLEQADVLRALIGAASGELSDKEQKAFRRRFDRFYDRFRAPGTGPDFHEYAVAPFEFAIVRESYLTAPGQRPTAAAVIAAYAA